MSTKQQILEYIKEKGQATSSEMADYLGISRQALFRHLPVLLEQGLIYKVGKPPKVFYFLKEASNQPKIQIDDKLEKEIQENYLFVTPAGERLEGVRGFTYWCDRNNLPYEKTAQEYVRTLKKYNSFKEGGLIGGLQKMRSTFGEVYLDEIFYLDFYSIERFGKTKLGQLLLYAKQSQNLQMMKEIIALVKPKVNFIVNKFKVDGIGFVPPTVKRERQLMRVLKNGLEGSLREVSIVKIKTMVAVPQKSLNRIEDRIENAKSTFVVDEDSKFENILLVDDAVGSGATLNEVAKKIRQKNICHGKIIGLAITGSYKGFDVISEV